MKEKQENYKVVIELEPAEYQYLRGMLGASKEFIEQVMPNNIMAEIIFNKFDVK